MKTKFIAKTTEFLNMPKLSDFEIKEEDIDDTILDDELLTKAVAISVDPYIRCYPNPVGQYVGSFQAARVLKSEVEEYPVDSIVMFHGGWKTITKTKKSDVWYRVDNLIPEEFITRAVGVLGMPGLTAFLGFLEICKPKKGETVMVNACAGAVGTTVGQIAKIKGCRVVGCCGSDKKMEYCKTIGYDDVFNYKTENVTEALKRIAPNGIDCFFDNVGGQMASEIIAQMKLFGRISVCGAISMYNEETGLVKADSLQRSIASKHLKMKGFVINHPKYVKKFPDALAQMVEWLKEGKMVAPETITEGFENLPKAFIDMLSGGNTGKAVVRL